MKKVSCKIGQKAENISLHTSIKISENFIIKHLRWSKADLSKETNKQKKDSKERYSTNFSSSRPEVYCKKDVLKNFATCLIACH